MRGSRGSALKPPRHVRRGARDVRARCSRLLGLPPRRRLRVGDGRPRSPRSNARPCARPAAPRQTARRHARKGRATPPPPRFPPLDSPFQAPPPRSAPLRGAPLLRNPQRGKPLLPTPFGCAAAPRGRGAPWGRARADHGPRSAEGHVLLQARRRACWRAPPPRGLRAWDGAKRAVLASDENSNIGDRGYGEQCPRAARSNRARGRARSAVPTPEEVRAASLEKPNRRRHRKQLRQVGRPTAACRSSSGPRGRTEPIAAKLAIATEVEQHRRGENARSIAASRG